ncbi:MAG: hypothetical protein RL558_481, partial [Bacteroidota bacterium]
VLDVVFVDDFELIDSNQFNRRFIDELLGVYGVVSDVEVQYRECFFGF